MCGKARGSSTEKCPGCGETFLVSDEPAPGTYLRIAALLFALAGIVWAFAVDSDPLGMTGAVAFAGIAASTFVFSRFAQRAASRRRQMSRSI